MGGARAQDMPVLVLAHWWLELDPRHSVYRALVAAAGGGGFPEDGVSLLVHGSGCWGHWLQGPKCSKMELACWWPELDPHQLWS